MDTYGHLFPEQLQETAAVLDGLYAARWCSDFPTAMAAPLCFDWDVPNLRALVAEYKRDYRRAAADELDDFRRSDRTDADAVSQAGLAQLPTGKRHPHQYRIPPASLQESRRRLLQQLPKLRKASSFDDLFGCVSKAIGDIHRVGELAIYDTALRIGARFGLEPDVVYLHRGTRDGARYLGLPTRSGRLAMSEVPRELRTLSPRELEDFLCIFKDAFREAGSQWYRCPSGSRRNCGQRAPRKRSSACAGGST